MGYNELMFQKPNKIFLSIALFFFVIYGLSTTPHLTGIADADELAATSYFLSVPHPPGFPLFTLVGNIGINIFNLITNPAHAANLLSAVYGALANSILFLVFVALFKQTKEAVIATLIFGLSFFIWNYSTIYEITTFTYLLAAFTLYLAQRWHDSSSTKFFFATWITAGILLSHYHLAFLIFPALLWLLLSKKSYSPIKTIYGISLLFLSFAISSLSLFLLKTDRLISWDLISTPQGLWHHLTRQDYQGVDVETGNTYQNAFAVPNLIDQKSLTSIIDYFKTIISHFGVPTFILIILGAIYLKKQNPSLLTYICLLIFFTGPVLVTYIETASYSFQLNLLNGIAERQYLLGQLSLSFLIVPGLLFLKHRLNNKSLLHVIGFSLVIFQIVSNHNLLFNKFDRNFNYNLQKQKLLLAPQDSLIICSTDIDCYTLWYLSRIEQVRTDISVVSHVPVYSSNYLSLRPSVYPFSQSDNPAYLILLIAHNFNRRPIYFTSGIGFYDKYFGLEDGPFYLVPELNMFRLSAELPSDILHQPQTVNPLLINHRARYSLGIIEAISNNLAYSGYLSLKYNQPDTANLFLNEAYSLDPANSQALELINYQQEIIPQILVNQSKFEVDQLISQAETAIANSELDQANNLYLRALLLDAHNPNTLKQIQQYYSSQQDHQMVDLVDQLLIYNNQAPDKNTEI